VILLLLDVHQVPSERALCEALSWGMYVACSCNLWYFGRGRGMVAVAVVLHGCVMVVGHVDVVRASGYHHSRKHRLLVLLVVALQESARMILEAKGINKDG